VQGQKASAEINSATGEERPRRQEREERILDAAAELIQRWGYKKTTIDDIVRLAGVAKSTIYLHWKTREDLFTALLLRESVEASLDMLELIKNDPVGVYLHNVAKHAIYVIMTRPLAKALFIGDVEVLGELVKNDREDIGFISQHKITASQGMFELLRQKGMVRADQDIKTQMKVFNAIFMGFMIVNLYVPEELQLSPEETAEALAESIQRTLEPGEPVSPQALQEVRDIWDQVAQQFMVLLKERLQKEMD
jgi:AcrR family transcriptional regulator